MKGEMNRTVSAASRAVWAVRGKRCKAVRERRDEMPYWGRCDLPQGHSGDHELERGMDEVHWSTDETFVRVFGRDVNA